MTNSDQLYQRACRVLPGGVTASARLNRILGRPLYVSHGQGSKLYDLDGRQYIDMCTSFGASLLGHGHPRIREALAKAGELGVICAMENPYQTELAEKLAQVLSCAEMARFTLSGTETTWYAIRTARVATGRVKIIKLEGHFHGFNPYLQYNFWPPLPEALPKVRVEAVGSPEEMRNYIIVLPFNDFDALEETLTTQGDEIAAIILEPLNYNSGGIRPRPGYLQKLRQLTAEKGVVLIFDEILSGFCTGPDCIQGYYGVMPDLCTIGKALGGGTPLSAFVGKREIMDHVAPLGQAMHSGTYNANLVNVIAANAFMDEIMQSGFYAPLLTRSERLYQGMDAAFQRAGLRARVQGTGCRFSILFGDAAEGELVNYRDAARQDWAMAYRFFAEATARGVYFHTMWHHGLSAAHTDWDVDRVLEIVEAAARRVAALSPEELSAGQETFTL